MVHVPFRGGLQRRETWSHGDRNSVARRAVPFAPCSCGFSGHPTSAHTREGVPSSPDGAETVVGARGLPARSGLDRLARRSALGVTSASIGKKDHPDECPSRPFEARSHGNRDDWRQLPTRHRCRDRHRTVRAGRARRSGSNNCPHCPLGRRARLVRGCSARGSSPLGTGRRPSCAARGTAALGDRSAVGGALDEHSPADVLADLEALVAAQPLRERRWSLLLLAYERAGRRVPTACAPSNARGRTLALELGVPPGPELVTRYESLLRDDDATPETSTSSFQGVTLGSRALPRPRPRARTRRRCRRRSGCSPTQRVVRGTRATSVALPRLRSARQARVGGKPRRHRRDRRLAH